MVWKDDVVVVEGGRNVPYRRRKMYVTLEKNLTHIYEKDREWVHNPFVVIERYLFRNIWQNRIAFASEKMDSTLIFHAK